MIKCNQCHLHDFRVNCCTHVIVAEPKIHFISENKVFNKYLYVKRLPISFFAQPLFSAISKKTKFKLWPDFGCKNGNSYSWNAPTFQTHSLQILCSSRT